MQTDLAPIVLFVYNRPWHARQTLEALSKNVLADKSKLYIFADGPKENATEEQLQKIKEVRNLTRERKWCGEVEIMEREKNLGLADSVITGVTEIVNRYGKIIVLEDDLVTSVGFLKYMNEGLDLYEKEEKVMHISGYMFPVKRQLPETFFLVLSSCWGWGTWNRAWSNFCINSKTLFENIIQSNNSYNFNVEGGYNYIGMLKNTTSAEWAINWYGSVFLKNGLCLHPGISLVRNIGFDNSGTNCRKNQIYLNQTIGNIVNVVPIPLTESRECRMLLRRFFLSIDNKNFYLKMKEKINGFYENAIKQ